MSFQDYDSDPLLRCAVERQFEIAGEATSQLSNKPIKVPDTFLTPFLLSAQRKPTDDERYLRVRRACVHALRMMGANAKPAVSDLITALRYPISDVRENACHALKAIGPDARNAVPALRDLLQDKDEDVQIAAKQALEIILAADR